MTGAFASRRRAVWASLGLIAVAALVVAYLMLPFGGMRQDAPPLAGEMRKVALTMPPALIPPVSFSDETGRRYDLRAMRGKVVLLNLWATWCAPCVAEMPSLDRLQGELGSNDFEVVALSFDKAGAGAVAPFFEKQGIRNLRTYLDPAGAALRPLQVAALPTTILIDKEGREVGRVKGDAKWDGPDAKALIRHYLAAAPK